MEHSLLLLLYVWALGTVSLLASAEVTEQCPERILGNERRRTCPKKCEVDKNCGNKRQCLCDGQCGLSCVAPGRPCPWPLTPGNHSEAVLLSPTPSFSALLEVRCHPGYTMANGLEAAIRRCQGDKQWSGDDPVCIGTPTLPSPLVAKPLNSCDWPKDELLQVEGSAAVGFAIRYSCPAGSVLVGNDENYCHDNQTWHYPHSICQRVFCPPPEEVKQGYLVAVQRKEYEVGDTIYYLCKKTFSLDGPNKVTCLSNGTWSAVPFCRAHCPIPAQRSRVIVDGVKRWSYDLTDGMVQHGVNVTFFCKHPEKQCSLTSMQTCFDGELTAPTCYLNPTWLQYIFFPHRLISEIDLCDPADLQ